MIRIITLITVFLTPSFVYSQNKIDESQFYPIDNGHSFVTFSITYMGYAEVRGNFERFDGTFRYDPNDITKTSVSLLIETSSIDTDLEFRDKDLKSDNWFNVEKYPYMKFISSSTEPTDEGFLINGELTIKETTKNVTLKMKPASGVLKDMRGDIQVIMRGSVEIDRTEFGVAGENWSKIKEGVTGVSNTVEIEFSILGKQLQESNLRNFVKDESRPAGQLYTAYTNGGLQKLKSKLETIDKLRPWYLNNVAENLLKQDKVKDAIEVFKMSISSFPDFDQTQTALARAYLVDGQNENAKDSLNEALKLNPNNMNAYEMLRHL